MADSNVSVTSRCSTPELDALNPEIHNIKTSEYHKYTDEN